MHSVGYNKYTHILCLITYFFSKYRAVCEIVWENMVHPYSPRMTKWRMRVARWIHKATNILSEYVILVACQLRQWSYEHISVLRHT